MSGGVVAHVLIVVAVFGVALRGFGPKVAIGSLVPLTFASTGMLWLSGRITGGHLPVVAWSAAAWWLLLETLRGRGWPFLAALGLWCGLGLYLDSMFVMTLAGMAAASLVTLAVSPAIRQAVAITPARLLTLGVGFAIGVTPAYLGRKLEPHDVYNEQFTPSFESPILKKHARILFAECLPRLIAGHRVPGLEADPDPRLLGLDAPVRQATPSAKRFEPIALLTTGLSLGLFALGLLALAWTAVRRSDRPARRVVAAGLLVSTLGVLAGFLVNRNIFNSDNYRYLVLLLIPWSLGLGLLVEAVLSRPSLDRWLGGTLLLAFAALFTADAAAWYRRMDWIDARLMPVRRPLDDVTLRWLGDHPDVRAILGGYWDVYRLSFLSEGNVRGVPFAVFPNRFPEWSKDLPEGRPETLIARQTPEGRLFLDPCARRGGRGALSSGRPDDRPLALALALKLKNSHRGAKLVEESPCPPSCRQRIVRKTGSIHRPGTVPTCWRSSRGRPSSPGSSGTPSRSEGLFSTSTSPRSISRIVRFSPRSQGRPLLSLVPDPLLRDAALQREPGGLPAPAQVSSLSLDGDLEGVQLRHGPLDLDHRRGDLWLAASAGAAGRGARPARRSSDWAGSPGPTWFIPA
ncbi:MAG: hypothetical protein QM755_15145 [Luteolibacter sp.]